MFGVELLNRSPVSSARSWSDGTYFFRFVLLPEDLPDAGDAEGGRFDDSHHFLRIDLARDERRFQDRQRELVLHFRASFVETKL